MKRTLVATTVASVSSIAAALTLPSATAQDADGASRDADAASSNVTVRGTARLDYPAPDEVLRFTVDAHAENGDDGFPGPAWGTARFSHRRGPVASWAKVAVDCVVTGGPIATLTGIVTASSPDNEDLHGTRIGFTVYDDPAGDRVGFTGGTQPDDPPLRKCMAIAPTFTVMHGDYTVESSPTS